MLPQCSIVQFLEWRFVLSVQKQKERYRQSLIFLLNFSLIPFNVQQISSNSSRSHSCHHNAVTFTLIHKWTCFFQSFITSTDSRFTSLKCSLGVRLNSSWITGCRNCWNCSKTSTRVCISQTVLKFKH